jgi:hypothetical protein
MNLQNRLGFKFGQFFNSANSDSDHLLAKGKEVPYLGNAEGSSCSHAY